MGDLPDWVNNEEVKQEIMEAFKAYKKAQK